MRLPTDPRPYLGLSVGTLALVAVCVVVGLESDNPELALLGPVLGLLLWAGVRLAQDRSDTPVPEWASQVLFWVDLTLSLAVVGYLAQQHPIGAALTFIVASALVGWAGTGLARDVITHTVRPRHVVRFVLLVATVGVIASHLLHVTGVGWHGGWATQLLILAAASALIGAVLTSALSSPARPPHHLP